MCFCLFYELLHETHEYFPELNVNNRQRCKNVVYVLLLLAIR